MLRTDLPDLPRRFKKLPIDARGYPVPAFVGVDDDDDWDFRVIKPGFRSKAYRLDLCWLCGEKLGTHRCFVVGPMCVINRISSEPPSHRDCAEFAAKACPFLTRPLAKRPDKPLPKGSIRPPGNGILRNPKCCAVVEARKYAPINCPDGGQLIQFSEPFTVEFWSQGRPATRAEVDESIETGLPLLEAEARRQNPEAVRALAQQVKLAQRHLPPHLARDNMLEPHVYTAGRRYGREKDLLCADCGLPTNHEIHGGRHELKR